MLNIKNYNLRSSSGRSRKRFTWPLIILLLIAYIVVVLFLPLPKLTAQGANIPLPVSYQASISWPAYGQAAVGAQNYGVLATHGKQVGTPIASIAKTMVALAVLKQKPLKLDEQGPSVTMTANDVKLYSAALAQNGSVVPVQLGESLTEYQLLQALLVPSGDNIADSLADWAYGSTTNYLSFANEQVAQWGLKNTHFADASGLSAQTVSSAEDLVILGEKILAEPVLAQIVSQAQVTLPIIGTARNYNSILGQENIIGIKTGNTNEAGGCFLFAAKTSINNEDVTLIGAILDATSRNQALADTKTFLRTNAGSFQLATTVLAGQEVGSYQTPWGKEIKVTAKSDLSILTLAGEPLSVKANFNPITKATKKGTIVGTITATSGEATATVPAVLESTISRPPFFWRLFHP